jgi:hypothetical protein
MERAMDGSSRCDGMVAEAAACEGAAEHAAQPRRRSSSRITLVLIGAASISGCGDPAPAVVQRDLYEHRSKCVQDWGDERKCELITEGQYRGFWYGPGYGGSRSTGYSGYRGTPGSGADNDASRQPAQSNNAVATHRVTRSGFGSSAHSYSSGS